MKSRIRLDRIRFFFLDAVSIPAGYRRLAHDPAIESRSSGSSDGKCPSVIAREHACRMPQTYSPILVGNFRDFFHCRLLQRGYLLAQVNLQIYVNSLHPDATLLNLLHPEPRASFRIHYTHIYISLARKRDVYENIPAGSPDCNLQISPGRRAARRVM